MRDANEEAVVTDFLKSYQRRRNLADDIAARHRDRVLAAFAQRSGRWLSKPSLCQMLGDAASACGAKQAYICVPAEHHTLRRSDADIAEVVDQSLLALFDQINQAFALFDCSSERNQRTRMIPVIAPAMVPPMAPPKIH